MSLSVSGLCCVRGERALFGNVSAEVAAGSALWVRGHNGSGKTSLLRLLCGLATPAAGEVRWRGHSIRVLREDFKRELLYIGHASGLKDDLTASENLLLGALLAGRNESPASAKRALAQVGLGRVEALPASNLSQGQRRRVALARLYLAPVPPLLILDEPFAALDQDAADQLGATLGRHVAQGGVLVYTTHQPVDLQSAPLQVLELEPAIAC